MRISDWSSVVCSSDLETADFAAYRAVPDPPGAAASTHSASAGVVGRAARSRGSESRLRPGRGRRAVASAQLDPGGDMARVADAPAALRRLFRSEEQPSELQ